MVVKLGFAFDIPREDDTRSAVVEVQRIAGWVGGSFVCVGEPRPSKIGGRAAAAARMQGGSRSQHSLTSVSRRRAVICRLLCARFCFFEKKVLWRLVRRAASELRTHARGPLLTGPTWAWHPCANARSVGSVGYYVFAHEEPDLTASVWLQDRLLAVSALGRYLPAGSSSWGLSGLHAAGASR